MPTYEYACPSCGHQFEKFQSMKDAPLKECPACGKKKVKRLVGGGAGLIFKGTGFYITDYKKKSGGESKSGESKPSEAKSSGSEAKPASTPTPAAPAAKPSTSAAKK